MSNSTPANRHVENDGVDPFANYLGKERAELALGRFTDDEVANGVFLYGGDKLDIMRVTLDKDYVPPIGWLTAAKERIRWLSRKLMETAKENEELRKRIAELEQ